MRDYSTLHLDINSRKGMAILLMFCISATGVSNNGENSTPNPNSM